MGFCYLMKRSYRILSLLLLLCISSSRLSAQLQITESDIAIKLARYLVGSGVVVSNATLKSGLPVLSTGFFKDTRGGTIMGLDSGVVLTTGRVKTDRADWGVDGDGSTIASAVLADQFLGLEGDQDLADQLAIPLSNIHDAVILEFDFTPLGDTVKFRYVMGSEEYVPAYVCTFNDAFAFFISGPGIVGKKNIALVPNTTTPVSIKNVNDIPSAGCVNNPAYYVNSSNNRFFTYDGHTTVLTAISAVQPCQVYHLKLVIADMGDYAFDSGVFLEAKSLSSNTVKLQPNMPVDQQGNHYLVEGCTTGTITVKRPYASPSAAGVTLSFGGVAINGVDVQALPVNVVIPANSDQTTVNIIPLIDNLPEGIEDFTIYASAGCTLGVPSDSIHIQIRDYDTLAISPKQKGLCKGSSIQLVAAGGYNSYKWDPNPTLNNLNVFNPIATPVADSTWYICSADLGNCHARDSAFIKRKTFELVSHKDVNCKNETIGQIKTSGGWEWDSPLQFSINNGPWQADSTFSNLPVGNYVVKIKDATGCRDSVTQNIIQLFPDLQQQLGISPASCSGNPDGSINITASGGNSPYLYSVDGGINFVSTSQFNLVQGNYQVMVSDNNGCTVLQAAALPLNDTVYLVKSADGTICESKSWQFAISTNAAEVSWSPIATLNNPVAFNPIATPPATTRYYVTAKSGICVRTDSINVFVDPAPVADAGPDTSICFGGSIKLQAQGGNFYKWFPSSFLSSNASASPVASPTATIYYMLNVGDNNGCVSLHPDTIKISVVPAVKLFAGNDTVAAVNQPLQLNAVQVSNSGPLSYSWSPAYGLNDPYIASPVAKLDRDMVYTVTGRTQLGCLGTDQVKIKTYKGPEIYVPNAFSPNNDGLNDVLKAITAGIKTLKYFNVYDRWGKMIFSTSNSIIGWDGKIKGIPSSTGTYVWFAEAVDYLGNTIQRKGTVIVLQ